MKHWVQFFLEHASTIKKLFNEDVDVPYRPRESTWRMIPIQINVESSKGRVKKWMSTTKQ